MNGVQPVLVLAGDDALGKDDIGRAARRNEHQVGVHVASHGGLVDHHEDLVATQTVRGIRHAVVVHVVEAVRRDSDQGCAQAGQNRDGKNLLAECCVGHKCSLNRGRPAVSQRSPIMARARKRSRAKPQVQRTIILVEGRNHHERMMPLFAKMGLVV